MNPRLVLQAGPWRPPGGPAAAASGSPATVTAGPGGPRARPGELSASAIAAAMPGKQGPAPDRSQSRSPFLRLAPGRAGPTGPGKAHARSPTLVPGDQHLARLWVCRDAILLQGGAEISTKMCNISSGGLVDVTPITPDLH